MTQKKSALTLAIIVVAIMILNQTGLFSQTIFNLETVTTQKTAFGKVWEISRKTSCFDTGTATIDQDKVVLTAAASSHNYEIFSRMTTVDTITDSDEFIITFDAQLTAKSSPQRYSWGGGILQVGVTDGQQSEPLYSLVANANEPTYRAETSVWQQKIRITNNHEGTYNLYQLRHLTAGDEWVLEKTVSKPNLNKLYIQTLAQSEAASCTTTSSCGYEESTCCQSCEKSYGSGLAIATINSVTEIKPTTTTLPGTTTTTIPVHTTTTTTYQGQTTTTIAQTSTPGGSTYTSYTSSTTTTTKPTTTTPFNFEEFLKNYGVIIAIGFVLFLLLIMVAK